MENESPGTRLDCVCRVGGRWVSPRLACRSAVHGQGYTFDAVLCMASELFRAYEVEVRPARRPAALRLAVRYAPVEDASYPSARGLGSSLP